MLIFLIAFKVIMNVKKKNLTFQKPFEVCDRTQDAVIQRK